MRLTPPPGFKPQANDHITNKIVEAITLLSGGEDASVSTLITGSSTATSTSYTTPSFDNLVLIKNRPALVFHPVILVKPTDNFSDNSSVASLIVAKDSFFDDNTDVTIASLAISFILIAILGNILSLLYFSKKGKLTVPSFLYILIGSFDLCIAITAVPVIASLLNSRAETWFENDILCLSWPPIFYFLKRMSMFLVMMISFTRSIAMSFPFLQIHIKDVSVATFIYGLFIAIGDIAFLAIDGLFKTKYRDRESSCEIYNIGFEAEPAAKFYSILFQMEIIFPCMIIFTSFILCLTSLVRDATEFKSEEMKKFRTVSITITLFAGTFLFCNIPAFLLQLNYLILYLKEAEEVKETKRRPFMDWYGHLLSHFFLTLFNAAANPCLYILRMPFFRQWIIIVVKDPRMLLIKVRKMKRSAASSIWLTTSPASSRRSTATGRTKQAPPKSSHFQLSPQPRLRVESTSVKNTRDRATSRGAKPLSVPD